MKLKRLFNIAALAVGTGLACILARAPVTRAYNEAAAKGGTPFNAREKAIALSIFGDAIDVDALRRHTATHDDPRNRACVMPYDRRNIHFFDTALARQDFSRASHDDFNTFVHELNHIFENSNTGLIRLLLQPDAERLDYFNDIEKAQSLKDFNHEQRSYILADYASLFLHPHHAQSLELSFGNNDIEKIKSMVEKEYPQAKITRTALESKNPTAAQRAIQELYAGLYVPPPDTTQTPAPKPLVTPAAPASPFTLFMK